MPSSMGDQLIQLYSLGPITGSGSTAAATVIVDAPTGVAATDTAAVTAAQNTLRTAGGGTLVFRAGTYVINKDTLIVETAWHIKGQGQNATVIKLANTQNGTLFKSVNYTTALAAANGGGPYLWSLSDLTLDGNKANQTSGIGIQIYGFAFRIENVYIRDCKGLGIDSRWQSGSAFFGLGSLPLEPVLRSVYVFTCDGGGIYWTNNDSSFDRVYVAYCGPSTTAGATAIGIEIAAGGQGLEATSCHVYGNQHKYAWKLSATLCMLSQCQGEGAQDAQVLVTGNQLSIQGGSYFAAGSYGTAKGIQIGDGTIYPDLVDVNTQILNTTGGALYAASEGSAPKYNLSIYLNSGTVFTGTPNPARKITYNLSGAATVGTPGGAAVAVGGWTPSQNNLLAASLDPSLANTNTVLPGGTVIAARVQVETPILIANVVCYISTAGTTLTAGQNWIGVYTSGGTLLGKSADQTTAWVTTGVKTAAITAESGQSLSVGGPGQYVYVAWLSNGTGPVRPANGNLAAGALLNVGLSGGGGRALYSTGGVTTLPSTISPLSSVHDKLYWAGLT